MSAVPTRLRKLVRARSVEPHPDVVRLTPEDRRYLTSFHDDRVPLPPGAGRELSQRNPRLRELREAYAALDLPVTAPRAGTSRRSSRSSTCAGSGARRSSPGTTASCRASPR